MKKNKILYAAAFKTMLLAGTTMLPVTAYSDEEGKDAVVAFDEMIVTAQKREQNLMEVPLSVTAFGEVTIEDANITEIKDLVLLTAGLQINETIGRQTAAPSIRGIAPFGFADPTVLIYVDGFTLGFSRTENNGALFDLERIEVLKGPQPTLYGRNALGGVINYITKKPGDELEGYVRGEYGRFETFEVAGSVGGPIIKDKVFAKVAVGYREFGGFMDNEFDGAEDVNDESDFSSRANLRLTPSEELEINLTFNYGEAEDACGDCAHVPQDFGSIFDPNEFLRLGNGEIELNDVPRTVNQDFLGGFDREDISFIANIDYDLGFATLTNIFGYGDSETSIRADVTRQPGPSPFGVGFDVQIDNSGWSDELRLASNGDGALTWLVGFYAFYNERARQLFFDGPTLVQDDVVTTRNYAGFVDLDYAISEKFSVGFGIRYDWEKNSFSDNLSPVERERSAGEWLPKFTASYSPSDDMNIYATISRGYHAGGTNDELAPSPEYDSEFIWNYEIGLKGQTADGKIQYNLAAYYMDWQSIQIQQPTGLTGGFITNAGSAEVYGVEASLLARPIEGLTLSLAANFSEATYKEYIDNINAAAFGLNPNLAGNDLNNAPDVAISGSVQYVFPISNADWNVRLRADGRYTGEQAFDAPNVLVADSYFIANLYAGVENETFEIGFYADNIFDENYLLGGSASSSFFPPLLNLGDPAIYGVRGRINF